MISTSVDRISSAEKPPLMRCPDTYMLSFVQMCHYYKVPGIYKTTLLWSNSTLTFKQTTHLEKSGSQERKALKKKNTT